MLKSIIEKNQTHWFVIESIIFEHFIKFFLDNSIVTKILIKSWIFGFLISRISHFVITEDDWIFKYELFDIFEVFLDNSSHDSLGDQFLICFVYELIAENSVGFMSPKSDKCLLGLEFVYSRLK